MLSIAFLTVTLVNCVSGGRANRVQPSGNVRGTSMSGPSEAPARNKPACGGGGGGGAGGGGGGGGGRLAGDRFPV